MYEKESSALASLHELFDISAYALNIEGTVVLKQCAGRGYDAVGTDETLRRKLMDACRAPGDACVYYDASKFYYLIYRTSDWYYIAGPAYAAETGELSDETKPVGKQNISLPVIEEKKLCSAMNLLRISYGDTDPAWKRHERAWKPERSKEIVSYKYKKFNADYQHVPYSIQKGWMDAIRTGDVDALYRIAEMTNRDELGMLAETDLKQSEYHAVVAIVIANLAAIEGGVDSDQAYELSDVFFQRLEKCTSTTMFDEVIRDSVLAYVELVRQKKNSSSNYHVGRCRDYIAAHIQENIKVSALAESVGLDESYLGRIFKDTEGVTIKEYIRREKMKVAAEMLAHSDATIAEISDFLGFHSKSYFGEIFLKTYQLTPLNYRTKNKTR